MTEHKGLNVLLGVGLAGVMALVAVMAGAVVWGLFAGWILELALDDGRRVPENFDEAQFAWELYPMMMKDGWEWIKEFFRGTAWFITGGTIWLGYELAKWGFQRCQWDKPLARCECGKALDVKTGAVTARQVPKGEEPGIWAQFWDWVNGRRDWMK